MDNYTLSIFKIGSAKEISAAELIASPRFSSYKITYINSKEDLAFNLKAIGPDIILAEIDCDELDVRFILKYLNEQNLKTPVICLIHPDQESSAIEMIDEGLSDYLFLDNLKRLPNAIRQLVDKYRLQLQNNQRYQYLYDQNLAGLYVTSVKGIVLECNAAFAQMLGFGSPQDLIGIRVEDLYRNAGDREVFIGELRKHGKLNNYENELIHQDGSTIYSLENIFLANDPLTGEEICQGVMIDISQLVITKQNITRARSMLTEGQKLASMGNWNYNLIKKELTISAGLRDIFNLAKSDTINLEKFLRLVDIDDRRRVICDVMNLSGPGAKISNNFRLKLPDGKLITVAAVHTHDVNDKGEVLRYYGVIQDITALNSAEKERDRIYAELLKRNEALEQFTYVISHNLKAPIANIKALTQILEHSFSETEEIDIINKMTLSVANLDAVIADLNQILQIKQYQNAAQETIDFHTIISSIQLSIKNLIIKEHVKFELNLSCATSIVSIKSYLYSVFYNLTLNSIKYRNPDIDPILKITCIEEGSEVIITFQDNGKGIDLEKHGSQLFGLYKRFDSSIDGKGLGLYMVKSQIEELGGTISVESTIMQGTTFIIRLPGHFD